MSRESGSMKRAFFRAGRRLRHGVPALLALPFLLAAICAPSAQTLNPTPAEREARRVIAEREEAKRRHEAELEQLRLNAREAAQARARLEGEVSELQADRARLNTALIEMTARIRATEERAAVAEERLRSYATSEEAIRRSLQARRGVIADVLAALQRLGRRPPPAVLVSPEDMLQSVRAAILLGAVVPELRAEAEALATDLGELARLSLAARTESERLATELGTLSGERERLSALVAARQERIAQAERVVAEEASRLAALAGKVQGLEGLIAGIEKEIGAASRAAEAARKELEAQTREVRERFAAAAARDPARLTPRVAFQETRGLLPQPAIGTLARSFGEQDGFGGTTRGVTFATRAGALVAAPADGWIAFAGPFRSYGRVLILNTGGGYHVLLAGMERVDASVGQFVLAGEPLGQMGAAAAPGATVLGGDIDTPLLYVEFRKDGVSIDPAPWWSRPPAIRPTGAADQDEKARG